MECLTTFWSRGPRRRILRGPRDLSVVGTVDHHWICALFLKEQETYHLEREVAMKIESVDFDTFLFNL